MLSWERKQNDRFTRRERLQRKDFDDWGYFWIRCSYKKPEWPLFVWSRPLRHPLWRTGNRSLQILCEKYWQSALGNDVKNPNDCKWYSEDPRLREGGRLFLVQNRQIQNANPTKAHLSKLILKPTFQPQNANNLKTLSKRCLISISQRNTFSVKGSRRMAIKSAMHYLLKYFHQN